MKTAEEYLHPLLVGPEVPTKVAYETALAAVQAAIDDAGTAGQQLREALRVFMPDSPRPGKAPFLNTNSHEEPPPF